MIVALAVVVPADLIWFNGFFGVADAALLTFALFSALTWLTRLALPRLPRHACELRIDRTGLVLTVDQKIERLSWQDVQHVTTLRSHRARLTPNRVVAWTRRGLVPPGRHVTGVRMDGQGRLWLCPAGWFDVRSGEVGAAIARYAPGLWDDAHGQRSGITEAVFVKRRLIRSQAVILAIVLLAVGVAGVYGVASEFLVRAHGAGAVAAGAVWMTIWGGLGAWALVLGALPIRLSIDGHGLRMRANLGVLDLAWQEVDEVSEIPGPYGPELLVRTDRGPVTVPAFAGRLGLTVDARLRGVRFPLGALAALPVEIHTALGRHGGARWRGRRERPFEDADEPPSGRWSFEGRLHGPLWRAGMTVGMGTAVVLTFLTGALTPPLALPLPAAAVVVATPLISVLLRQHCELRLDRGGLELCAATRRTHVPWSAVSRVELRHLTRDRFAITETPATLMVWLKEGATAPPRWRGWTCFTPRSGGIAVIGVRRGLPVAGPAVRADPSELRHALARCAGTAWHPFDPETRE